MSKHIVQIIFVSDAKVLLGFRQNTEAFDQLWSFPSGRVEEGELPLEAAKREALEEVAVEVNHLTLLRTLFDQKSGTTHYFYICESWLGEINNAEPHLCRELNWFDLATFPVDCTPITFVIQPELSKVVLNGAEK